jgi:predicted AAA+ superfamily ATPase
MEQLPALFVTGPRAVGKSTTLARRAATVIQLDEEAQATAFRADPDAALRGLAEPVLLDEWQNVPGVLGAIKRAVSANPTPGRFVVTGSVNAELENEVWPGTGRLTRIPMFPMNVREQLGLTDQQGFFERALAGELAVPSETPDLRGYVELALAGGFPTTALQLHGRPRTAWFDGYIHDLLTHDVEQAAEQRRRSKTGGSPVRRRKHDYQKLRMYFEAYAVNSAGVVQDNTLFEAAHIKRDTALVYEDLLADMFVIERVPAWATNRLNRLAMQPKRYLIDPALITTAARLDTGGVMRDGQLLGRVIDTFVASQLRVEASVSDTRPRMHHLRTKEGREEVDLIAELAGGQLIAFEIKADAAPNKHDARHLIWMRDTFPDKVALGVVFHTGPRIFDIDERIIAAPISALWG